MYVRAARLVVLAILIGIGISHIVFAVRDWPLGDMEVYLAAARRLREGQPLYALGDDPLAWDIVVKSYWYAPWFAAVWVPLTFLPRDIVAVGWSAVLVAATFAVVWLLARDTRLGGVLALLVGPPLLAVSAGGNVQSLMVLALLIGIHRPWGPIAVAAAASMKFTPILMVAAYAARKEWLKAGVAVGISAVLVVPGLLMGITRAGVQSDSAPSLLGVSPILYGVVVAVAALVALRVPTRHAAVAAATAAVLALPRLFVYDVTLIAVGAAKPDVEEPAR